MHYIELFEINQIINQRWKQAGEGRTQSSQAQGRSPEVTRLDTYGFFVDWQQEIKSFFILLNGHSDVGRLAS